MLERCVVSFLLGSFVAGVPLRSLAGEQKPSRCFAIETPAAPGKPQVFVAPGLTPRMTPEAVADLARGPRREAVVTCMELLPPDPSAMPGWIQAQAWWAVHVETPFSRIVSGARGSCKADHTMVFVGDEAGAVVSSGGIDQKCNIQPYDFTKGR